MMLHKHIVHLETLLNTKGAVAIRYREVENHDMVLPSGAKAYFLLQAANLTIDNERLARATAKLDYNDMKTQIQKVFGENVGNGAETLPVKTEECNAVEECNYTRGGGFRSRGARDGRTTGRQWQCRRHSDKGALVRTQNVQMLVPVTVQDIQV